MISKFGIIFIHVVVLQIASHTSFASLLEVQIFYETLCGSCQQFFIEQFQPNFEKFGDSIRWVLIPYEYAQTVRDNTTGRPISITCHHGELECRDNAIQACALRKIPDYLTQLRFCSCFMINRGGCDAFQRCSSALGIDYNWLNTCTANGEGLDYLSGYADIYNQIQPRTTNIVLNGRQLTAEEKAALYSNFCKFLCDQMPEPKAEVCKSAFPTPAPTPRLSCL